MVRLASAIAAILLSAQLATAQERMQKVGVILHGGSWFTIVDGLREGLKDLLESKRLVLDVRDVKGDRKAAEQAAEDLEREKVDLIFTVASSVSLSAKSATKRIPIIFAAGADPVAIKLVDSIRAPGGRVTGVHFRVTGIIGKRLELLKEIVPALRRAIVFYNPSHRPATAAAAEAREATRLLGIELLERHVTSVEQLRRELLAFTPNATDAYLNGGDAMVDSQSAEITAVANAKNLPTMFNQVDVVAQGGLASYSADFREVGLLSSKFVRRVLAGENPGDLPIESIDKFSFALNLRTAKQIGLSIPESLLVRADKVFE